MLFVPRRRVTVRSQAALESAFENADQIVVEGDEVLVAKAIALAAKDTDSSFLIATAASPEAPIKTDYRTHMDGDLDSPPVVEMEVAIRRNRVGSLLAFAIASVVPALVIVGIIWMGFEHWKASQRPLSAQQQQQQEAGGQTVPMIDGIPVPWPTPYTRGMRMPPMETLPSQAIPGDAATIPLDRNGEAARRMARQSLEKQFEDAFTDRLPAPPPISSRASNSRAATIEPAATKQGTPGESATGAQSFAWPAVAVVAIAALYLIARQSILSGNNVEISWKVTEKVAGKVVITKVKSRSSNRTKAA